MNRVSHTKLPKFPADKPLPLAEGRREIGAKEFKKDHKRRARRYLNKQAKNEVIYENIQTANERTIS